AEVAPSSIVMDLRHETLHPLSDHKFSAVVIDAPWYPDDLFAWIRQALPHLESGALMLLVLWRDDIRPSARRERKEILSLLSALGRVELYSEFVRYETPLFEKEALTHAGSPVGPEW